MRAWEDLGRIACCELLILRHMSEAAFPAASDALNMVLQARSSLSDEFPNRNIGSGAEGPSSSRPRRSAELARQPCLVRHKSREPER